MFRLLRSVLMLSGLSTTLACNSSSPGVPLITQGDYSVIIHYLKNHIPAQMAQHDVSGLSIALVNGQELIWVKGFGYADKAMGVPVSANTAFRAGGLSQLISAAAVLQLVNRRQLTLDQPIQEILPEFSVRSRFHASRLAADQDITVRRLLSHQSGLPSEHLRGLYSSFPMSKMPMRLSGVWLSTAPGTQTIYSSMGYTLLGAAIERITGLSFESQLQRSILNPLGMGQSSFIGDNTGISFRAQGYRNGVRRTDKQVRDLASSGLWTTPRDLSHYVRMLFAQGHYKDQRVLSKVAIDELFRSQNGGNTLNFGCQIGLAWHLSACGEEPAGSPMKAYHRSAASDGFSAQLTLLPDQQLAVIIMTNDGNALPLVERLSTDTLSMMLRAKSAQKAGTGDKQKQPDGQSQRPLLKSSRAHLAGTYATAKGIFRIKKENGLMYGELSGNRFQLLQDDNGWLRVKKQFFASRESNLGPWGRLPLNVITVHDRQILVAQRQYQNIQIGERVELIPLTDRWANTVGTYQILNPDEEKEQTNDISVRVEEGALILRGKLYSEDVVDYILTPIDNVNALLAGTGARAGVTVSRTINGLSLSGYYFKRTHSSIFSALYKQILRKTSVFSEIPDMSDLKAEPR